MTLSLNAAIANCPRALFGDRSKGVPPKYRKIFAAVVRALLTDAGEKFSEATVDLVASVVNVSSMQRSIADRRKFLEEGGVKPPKKERGKPRPKAASADEDDLGLGKPKKTGKKLDAKKAGKKTTPTKPTKKAAPAKTPAKTPAKAASGPKSAKPAGGTLDALAAARASLAAAKAKKEAKAGKAAKSTEEAVEI